MATAKPLVFSIRLTDWPLLGIILTTNGSCGLGNEFPNKWIPRKVFLCSLALLLRVRFRGYSFLISFVACLVTCEQAFSFLFSKQEGRRVPPRAVVSPGQTLRPSWRNHCSQGRRRIAWSQDTCLLSSIAYTLRQHATWVRFWSAGSAIIVFAPSFPVLPTWSRPSFAGGPRTEFPVTALAAHPACNFSPEVLSWFYLFALKEKCTLL